MGKNIYQKLDSPEPAGFKVVGENSPGKDWFFVNSRYAYLYTVANGELQSFQHPMVDNSTQLYISGFLNVVVESQSTTV
jgi:hypothetical protein